MAVVRSWQGRTLRGFALPSGPLAGLMGRAMAYGNGGEAADVLALLAPASGEHVVEVGYGPGTLVADLVAAGATVAGVDPSAVMHRQASRRNAAAVASGRVALGVGTAEETGLPSGAADAVVSMNTVLMWTDLAAGCAEARRLLRPGGRFVLSWHGGHHPSRTAARMAQPEPVLAGIEDAVRTAFGAAERRVLDRVVAFTATA